LITHGVDQNLHIDFEAKKYIVQLHQSLFPETITKFKSYRDDIVVTTDSQNPFTYKKLCEQIGQDKVHYLAGPMVPEVDFNADNFRKPYLTWSYRNFWMYLRERPKDLKLLFDLLKNYLRDEPELRIKIIVGSWDIWSSLGRNPTHLQLQEWAFSHEALKPFESIKDKIDFYANLHWYKVIEILKETRYIISPAEPLGCPAFEAAIFGIPTIVNNEVNPFMTLNKKTMFAEVLKTKNSVTPEFLNYIGKLQMDKNFYTQHGNAYRKWVNENATYRAYVNSIEKIIKQQGWTE
jgi:hypothetical protein